MTRGLRCSTLTLLQFQEIGVLVSLADLLRLYETGTIRTDLRVKNVASPILSMPRETMLRKVPEKMFSRKHRPIFVSRTGEFVGDRGIIEHVFSPAALSYAINSPPEDIIFGLRISELETTTAG